jgi:hypothetical protein
MSMAFRRDITSSCISISPCNQFGKKLPLRGATQPDLAPTCTGLKYQQLHRPFHSVEVGWRGGDVPTRLIGGVKSSDNRRPGGNYSGGQLTPARPERTKDTGTIEP